MRMLRITAIRIVRMWIRIIRIGLMKQFDFKKIIEWLGFVLKCPVCGHKYNLDQTRVIESDQDEVFGEAHILIHSDCNRCKSSVMFNIEVRGPEVFSVGMVTDLTSQDSSKFQKRNPIHVNEIITLHKDLKTFDGDFVRVLKKR
jgi:hypothetical protein